MRFGWIVVIAWMATGSAAQAAFTVSNQATTNVTCGAHRCASQARNANLNAGELALMLETGDVKLVAKKRARDIQIADTVSYASASRLTLSAFRSVTFTAPLMVMGPGSVAIDLGERETGGRLRFFDQGRLSFQDQASSLTVDGHAYGLAFSLAGLETNIFGDPTGLHALARDLDLSEFGAFTGPPMTVNLQGTLEGLGNTIRHLKVDSIVSGNNAGFFDDLSGHIVDLRFDDIDIMGAGSSVVGGIAAKCHSSIENTYVSGRVAGNRDSIVGGLCGVLDTGFIAASHMSGMVVGQGVSNGVVGGLVGQVTASGHVTVCYSTATVQANNKWFVGGLVGRNAGMVETSYASGAVTVGDKGVAGGLIGDHDGGNVFYTYANGQVIGGVQSTVGGLLGHSQGSVSASYSSGAVASGSGNAVGGFVGNDTGVLTMSDDYWDIDTSGQSHGAGNDPGELGITGLTTEQFQAGLPEGFPSEVWTEYPAINGGLPYLRALKP